MKKRLIAYGSLAAVLLALFGWCVLWPGPGVTLVNYFRIPKGASFQEVEDLLLNEADGPCWRYGQPVLFENQGCAEYWRGLGGTIIVFYDAEGHVVTKQWTWDGRWQRELANFLDDLAGLFGQGRRWRG